MSRNNTLTGRRAFLKTSGVVASSVLGAGVALSDLAQPVSAGSGSDPRLSFTDTAKGVVPHVPTPEGTAENIYRVGANLNYIETYIGETTGENIHTFSYGAKGISTYSPEENSSEYRVSLLNAQSMTAEEGDGDLLIDPTAFRDAPGFGVRPQSGGSLDWGDAAITALDSAIGILLGRVRDGLDIAYDATKAVAALSNGGEKERSSDKRRATFGFDHSSSKENESYTRFQALQNAEVSSRLDVRGTADISGPVELNFWMAPRIVGSNSLSTNSNGDLSIQTSMAKSPAKLRSEGYQLLTDNENILIDGYVSNVESINNPRVQRLAERENGRIYRAYYPIWGKSESENLRYEDTDVVPVGESRR